MPSDEAIQGVYVFVHWKPIFDDKMKVKLHWNGGSSSWYTLTTASWDQDTLDFSSETSWTATKVNSASFQVEIQKIDQGTADKILVDWVGTLVKYADLNITSVSVSNNPQKGDNVQFSISIENLGTSVAANVDTKIRIKYDTYDWSGYICDYLDWDTNLPAATNETHTITVGVSGIFSHDGNYYAWSVGGYIIDQVDATCNQGSTASYTIDVPFDVDGASSGSRKIFTVVYYDTEFTDLSWVSSVSSFFYSAVSHKMRLHTDNDENLTNYNDGLEEMMNVEYIGLFRSGWDPGDNMDLLEMLTNVSRYASDDLGLTTYTWSSSGHNETLTNFNNHGFDQLVGLFGTGSDPDWLGIAARNCVAIQAENGWGQSFGELILVHELSHPFGADDHNDPDPIPIYCVMREGWNNYFYIHFDWFVHWVGSYNKMTKPYIW